MVSWLSSFPSSVSSVTLLATAATAAASDFLLLVLVCRGEVILGDMILDLEKFLKKHVV